MLRTKCGLRWWLIAVMKPQPSLATMVDGAPGFRYHNTPSRTLAVFLGLSRQADDERHLNGLFHERRMQPGSGRV